MLYDQNVNKSRRSVNGEPLTVHFENSSAPEAASSKTAAKISETATPTLLQVFNSEFDKDVENPKFTKASIEDHSLIASNPINSSGMAPGSSHQTDTSSTERKFENMACSSKASPSEQIGQSIKQSVDDIARVATGLRLQKMSTSEVSQSAQHIAQTLEIGLNDALLKFDTCLKSIARSAQAATSSIEEKTCTETDAIPEDPWDALPGFSRTTPAFSQPCSHLHSRYQPAAQKCKAPQRQTSASLREQASTADQARTGSLGYHGPGPIHLPQDDASMHDHSNAPVLNRKAHHASVSEETSDDQPRGNLVRAGLRSSLPTSSRPSVSKDYTAAWEDPVPDVLHTGTASRNIPSVMSTCSQDVASSLYPPSVPFSGIRAPLVPRFPSLPSMEPMLPSPSVLRSYENPTCDISGTSIPVSRHPLQNLPSFTRHPTTSVTCLPGFPPTTSSRCGGLGQPFFSGIPSRGPCSLVSESSGQFFNRVTGLDAGPAQLDASVDPFSNLDAPRRADGLRRSATVAGLNDRYTTSSRRPYSTNFDGNGRMPWDAFIRPGSSRAQQSRATNDRAQTPPWNITSDSMPEFPMPGSSPPNTVTAEDHADDSSFEKARECAKQLRELGFGSEADGGMQRLMVYAQAAEGDLADAIDMIDEEQKAYGQRY